MNIWKKIPKKERAGITPFLKEREKYSVSAISRLNSGTIENVWAFLNAEEKSMSALLLYGKRILFPVFNFSLGQIEEFKKNGLPLPSLFFLLIKKKSLHAIQGLSDDLDLLEYSLKEKSIFPVSAYEYQLRCLHYPSEYSGDYSNDYSDNFDTLVFSRDNSPDVFFGKKPEGLIIRRAKIDDANELFPLQAAYEKEEVLPPGAEFNPAACRKGLETLITDNVIFTAELDGKLAGKININAQSYNYLQLGGVYVLPEYRSLGIARAMTAALIRSYAPQKKIFTLFVKKNNAPALRVYDSLGLKAIGEYRISYYS